MNIDSYGIVTISEKELIELIYSGKLTSLEKIYTAPTIADQFNKSKHINKDSFKEISTYCSLNISKEEFDTENQKQWFMPRDYCPNLIELLYGKCTNETQIKRVTEELELFVQHNMIDLLYYLKFLVDTMREHNILWGVGRGSSVASYILYLIGVHKIDSLKYNLDIKEFLK